MAYYGEFQYEYVPPYYALDAGPLYRPVPKDPRKLLFFYIVISTE